jgi:hypothetical protein
MATAEADGRTDAAETDHVVPPAGEEPERDETAEVSLLRKVSTALQEAVRLADRNAAIRFYVVVERAWADTQIHVCNGLQELKTAVLAARTEYMAMRAQNLASEMAINIFHGNRLFVQSWPVWAVVDGETVIPIDDNRSLPPYIDQSGKIRVPESLPVAEGLLQPPGSEVKPAELPPLIHEKSEEAEDSEVFVDDEDAEPCEDPKILKP